MILNDAKILLGGYDLSADHNQIAITGGRSAEPDSRFGDTTEVFAAGVRKTDVSASGFYRAAADAILDNALDVEGQLLTAFKKASVIGDEGESLLIQLGEYQPLRDALWGKQAMFSIKAMTQSARRFVYLLASGTKSVTDVGSAFRVVGGVPAGKKLYGGVHIIGTTGTLPTLDLTIQSDDAEAFATPTTRLTFAQQSAIGGVLPAGVDGAITDEWFRLAWTIGGTAGPSFNIFAWVAVQA